MKEGFDSQTWMGSGTIIWNEHRMETKYGAGKIALANKTGFQFMGYCQLEYSDPEACLVEIFFK